MQLGPFGIAHPIYNNRFNIPKKLTGTVSSVSGPDIFVNLSSISGGPDNTLKLFGSDDSFNDQYGRIDYVVLGPSTHANNPGAIENSYVLQGYSSPNNAIRMEKGTASYYYSSGDPITIVTHGMPDGWHGDAPGGTNHKFSYGSILSLIPSQMDGGGPYAFVIYPITQDANNIASLNIKPLAGNTTYRLDIKYRTDGMAASSALLRIYYGDGTVFQSITLDPTGGTWTVSSKLFTITANNTVCNLRVIVGSGCTAGSKLTIAGIAISHATPDVNSGTGVIVSSNVFPDIESVTVKRDQIGDKSYLDMSGIFRGTLVNPVQNLPVTRYLVSYSFSNIPETKVQPLLKLVEWSNSGRLINHFPGLPGVPFCLTGRLSAQIKMVRKIENLSLLSFQLSFEESII